jgi:molybdate transport system regulatory protein
MVQDRESPASDVRHLRIKSKIWIEDENGKIIFGSGRARILIAIEEYGSILAAAKHLEMSYRAVWGKIKATEERLGHPLLVRKAGGAQGGGSELTPLGKALVEQFRRLQDQTEAAANNLFDHFFKGAVSERTC